MIPIPPYVMQWLEQLQRDSYQKGWDEAMSALVKAASEARPVRQRPTQPVQKPKDTSRANRFSSPVNYAAKIARALTIKPGMTGSELTRWLRSDGGLPDAPYTSVRSTLLRQKGKTIEQRGDRWYAIQKAEAAE